MEFNDFIKGHRKSGVISRGGFRHVSLILVRDTLFLNSKLTASFRELSQQLTFVLLYFDFEMEPTITSSRDSQVAKLKLNIAEHELFASAIAGLKMSQKRLDSFFTRSVSGRLLKAS